MARKILLADDSVTAQNMGRKILVDAGYDVLTVNNGSAALKRITESKPDLIILDVYMPGYSGLEVCQRLKDAPETAHIPVLLSVGKLEPFKPQEARRVKANAHIVKPFEASELLSAIARLEDGMVPQAHKPSFCSPLPSSEGYGDDGSPAWETKTDTGRKSGSRGSSARKKESEAEDAVANFRDFRKVKGKAAEAEASLAPEIRDITKEELDALSAVAARLDGPAPSESAAATLIAGAPAESAQVSVQSAGANVESAQVNAQSAGANLGHMDLEVAEEVVATAAEMRAAAEPVEMPVVAVDAAASAVEAGNEIVIPVQQVEPATEVSAVQPQVESSPVELQAVESQPTEPKPAEPQIIEHQPVEIQASPEVTAETTVNTGVLAQEPAPVDRQDEPMFASAPAQENVETPMVEAEETRAHAETETQKEEAEGEKAKAVEAKVEVDAAVPVPATVAETVEAEAPVPSDEELAEALRVLTPATAYAEAVVSSQGQLNDDGCDALAGPRWMAEAVGLSPEEATMSLEAEMFRTFATAPAGDTDSAPVAESVSTITAAVENRLAEVASEREASSDEAPKAMAAAAAAETSAPAENSMSGSEEIAIASIVDQMLADLRPKIVEEIARKLGKSR